MEIAKLTSKGQITIPISIRKKLGVDSGDKLLFVEHGDSIIVVRADMDSLKEAELEAAKKDTDALVTGYFDGTSFKIDGKLMPNKKYVITPIDD